MGAKAPTRDVRQERRLRSAKQKTQRGPPDIEQLETRAEKLQRRFLGSSQKPETSKPAPEITNRFECLRFVSDQDSAGDTQERRIKKTKQKAGNSDVRAESAGSRSSKAFCPKNVMPTGFDIQAEAWPSLYGPSDKAGTARPLAYPQTPGPEDPAKSAMMARP